MPNLQPNLKRLVLSSQSSRTKLRHSRSRLNLNGKGSDRQEPQTTTFIAGRTDTKLLNHTLVPHATLGKLGIKKLRQRSTLLVEFNGAKNDAIDDKINHFALSLDCTATTTNAPTDDTSILDSGCTSNFLSAAPCSDKQAAHIPLNVNMPNGTTIQSSHTCNLLLADLPHQAQQAHILPRLVHNSLISVDKLCDNECSVTFTQDQVTVSRNGNDVMYRSQDPKSRLWRVNLKHKMNTKIAQCSHAHDNNNQKYLINYLQAACFSPVKSTWIKAIKMDFFHLGQD
jgi:hypothetical protein